ncbi:MAG: DMT family transporter [Anaerolineales bacterium]|nr:DMT family transporter [Anaerolineales bacterium]
MTSQALPYIVLLGFMYGSTLVASRFSVGQFAPATYIGLRLSLAALAHATIYQFSANRAWSRDRNVWQHALLLGVIGTAVPMTSIVTALTYLSSGMASILITINPAITVLLAHFFLHDEKLNTRKIVGIVLALSGTALLTVRGETGLADVAKANPIGYILMFTSILLGSSSTVYARKYMRTFDAFDVASIRMLAAALAVMPLSLLLVGFDLTAVTSTGYGALGYASLMGTFGGMMLAFYIIKRFGATASAMTAYVVPIITNIGGILLLGETFTVGMLWGALLIVVGIFILNQRRRPRTVAGESLRAIDRVR